MALPLVSRAPAKINLTLHILGRRADGYHTLESLVAFAGFGDTLHLEPDATLSLTVSGPMAGPAGDVADNLVLKALHALQERREGIRTGAFHLVKRIPVAAGLGGGSSDAAAALRLLAMHNSMASDDPILREAALACGADVPVCLSPRARHMAGIGERLTAPLDLPPLFAVLVNPGVKVATADVFSMLGLAMGETFPHSRPAPVPAGTKRDALGAFLAKSRNDLEIPARRVAPIIADMLTVLRDLPSCRLARMSGSGATAFGLFDDCRTASQARRYLASHYPQWWSRATILR